MPHCKDDIYVIKWHDAFSCCEWLKDFEEIIKGRSIVTEIGWIIYEDKEIIIICSQINTDGDLGNMTRIPKAMVIERKKLNGSNHKGVKHG